MIIAVDTGGTKTLIARFDNGKIVGDTIKFPTPRDSAEYTAEIIKHVTHLANNQPPAAISIAVPGITRNNRVERFANLPWQDFNIVAKLQPYFPNSLITVQNDANLGGLGEARLLPNTPERVLYVTVSTGIGTGFIVGGQIDQTMNNSEGGHMVLNFEGKADEWESFASGRAIHETYGKFVREIQDRATWEAIASRLSVGFNAILPVLQPDLVIIGGSVGTYFDAYGEMLITDINEHLNPIITTKPVFTQAKHPEEAVVYGCYFYAIDYLARR